MLEVASVDLDIMVTSRMDISMGCNGHMSAVDIRGLLWTLISGRDIMVLCWSREEEGDKIAGDDDLLYQSQDDH